MVNAPEHEADAVPLLLEVRTAGPQTVAPPAEPWWKLTVPVGVAPEAEAKLGVIVAAKYTV